MEPVGKPRKPRLDSKSKLYPGCSPSHSGPGYNPGLLGTMKVYRLRLVKLLLFGFIVANLVFFYYTWNTLLWRRLSRALAGGVSADNEAGKAKTDGGNGGKLSPKDKLRNANKHIRKSITIVFYGHYNFEQDLRPSIERYL